MEFVPETIMGLKKKILKWGGVLLATAGILGATCYKLDHSNRPYKTEKIKGNEQFSQLYNSLIEYKYNTEVENESDSNLEKFLFENYPETINEDGIDFDKIEKICEDNGKFCMQRSHGNPELLEKRYKDDKLLLLGDLKKDTFEYFYDGENRKVDYVIFSNVPFRSQKESMDWDGWYNQSEDKIYLNESGIKEYVENKYNSTLFNSNRKNLSYINALELEVFRMHPTREDFIKNVTEAVIKKDIIHELVHRYSKDHGIASESDALLEEMKDPRYNALTLMILRGNSSYADKSKYFLQYKLAEERFFGRVKENYGLKDSEVEDFVVNIGPEERSNLIKDYY